MPTTTSPIKQDLDAIVGRNFTEQRRRIKQHHQSVNNNNNNLQEAAVAVAAGVDGPSDAASPLSSNSYHQHQDQDPNSEYNRDELGERKEQRGFRPPTTPQPNALTKEMAEEAAKSYQRKQKKIAYACAKLDNPHADIPEPPPDPVLIVQKQYVEPEKVGCCVIL